MSVNGRNLGEKCLIMGSSEEMEIFDVLPKRIKRLLQASETNIASASIKSMLRYNGVDSVAREIIKHSKEAHNRSLQDALGGHL